jgi:hypothetical protein
MPDRQSDRSTVPARKRRMGQRLTRAERELAQAAFLDAFRRNANITAAALAAGIDRSTFYQWQEHDAEFALRYQQAEQAANDLLLAAAWKRAVQGVERPIVSMGKVIYGEDGRPLMIREYSDQVLLRLMSWRIPGFRESSSTTIKILPKTYLDLEADEDGVER